MLYARDTSKKSLDCCIPKLKDCTKIAKRYENFTLFCFFGGIYS